MPKGEHFKKPNPRINQVSFKVSDKELEALRTLAKAEGLSVPEWIRTKIGVKHDDVIVEEKVEVIKEEKVVEAPVEEKKIEKQAPSSSKGSDDDDEVIRNQMSLF